MVLVRVGCMCDSIPLVPPATTGDCVTPANREAVLRYASRPLTSFPPLTISIGRVPKANSSLLASIPSW